MVANGARHVELCWLLAVEARNYRLGAVLSFRLCGRLPPTIAGASVFQA